MPWLEEAAANRRPFLIRHVAWITARFMAMLGVGDISQGHLIFHLFANTVNRNLLISLNHFRVGLSDKMPYTYDYPHMAVTVDLALFDENEPPNVLLIKRAEEPFKGMWALPGGYVDMNERIEAAAIRELQEETKASVEKVIFLGYFDAINRDPRERTISFGFCASTCQKNQYVEAGDDAKDARWFSISKLPIMAFDHIEIIKRAMAVREVN